MLQDYNLLIDRILDSLKDLPCIAPEEIPSLDLYMDQVTTFMEDKLAGTRRFPEDKILTKTMINNYAKNKLLPPPEKKKYSREHILLLVFIYYFKGILPLGDVQSVLSPMLERFPSSGGSQDIVSIYEKIFRDGFPDMEQIRSQVLACDRENTDILRECSQKDREDLRPLLLICQLGMDIYVRRRIMEGLIDQCLSGSNYPDAKAKAKKKKE